MSELKQPKQPSVKEPVEERVEELSATDKVKVTNTSDRIIFLTSTKLMPGDSGMATFAEYTTLAQFLTRE